MLHVLPPLLYPPQLFFSLITGQRQYSREIKILMCTIPFGHCVFTYSKPVGQRGSTLGDKLMDRHNSTYYMMMIN